jgi:hypothetical protein
MKDMFFMDLNRRKNLHCEKKWNCVIFFEESGCHVSGSAKPPKISVEKVFVWTSQQAYSKGRPHPMNAVRPTDLHFAKIDANSSAMGE